MTKKQLMQRAVIALALTLPLAACGGGGGRSKDRVTPPLVVVAPPATAQEDRFGVAFGSAFRAPANGEPFLVGDGDLIPISFTTEPIDITP